MAVSLASAQSTWISTFRQDLALVLKTLSALDADRLKAASLGGIDGFAADAFAGANGDIAAPDLDAAMAATTALRALLFGTDGNPTPALLAIVKVADGAR